METYRELALRGNHLQSRAPLSPPCMGGNRAGAQRLGSPVPIPLPKARALNLLLLRLAVLGLTQVSGLWPPGSRLQAASENLWLEKVLASPIPASPHSTLHGLSRYCVPLHLLLLLLLLPLPSPGPLSLAKAIPLSSPLPAC